MVAGGRWNLINGGGLPHKQVGGGGLRHLPRSLIFPSTGGSDHDILKPSRFNTDTPTVPAWEMSTDGGPPGHDHGVLTSQSPALENNTRDGLSGD